MKVKLDHPKCMPFKKHHYDAGFDLVNANADVILGPCQEQLIHTGVYTAIPEGFVGLIFPRSSMGKAGLVLQNTVGVIDSHYRGEIMILAKNANDYNKIVIQKYQRFAQLVIVPVFLPELEVVSSLDETIRGDGGFGSTG